MSKSTSAFTTSNGRLPSEDGSDNYAWVRVWVGPSEQQWLGQQRLLTLATSGMWLFVEACGRRIQRAWRAVSLAVRTRRAAAATRIQRAWRAAAEPWTVRRMVLLTRLAACRRAAEALLGARMQLSSAGGASAPAQASSAAPPQVPYFHCPDASLHVSPDYSPSSSSSSSAAPDAALDALGAAPPSALPPFPSRAFEATRHTRPWWGRGYL